MKKYFCDRCAKEIIGDGRYNVVIQVGTNQATSQDDFCVNCFKELVKFFRTVYR